MATGVAQIEINGATPDVVCAEIRAYDSVTDLTVLDAGSETCQVQVETTVPVLLTSLQNAGVPLEMPFEVSDGQMTLEATVPQQTLSDLGTTLEKFGIQYTVERIQQEPESDSALLTKRQRWLLDEAIDRGYYDTPRRITLVDLADELDIAKSTCSEILHRAEERVLKDLGRGAEEPPSGLRATSD
ncbi:MAG: helix-turn-helix domain-containing protein [Halobacteriaceae archaeon]